MHKKDASDVKAAVTLSQVIADLTGQQPIGRGREVKVRCPFHEDTTPSLRINDEKDGGVWHCDPCAAGGDVFEFVKKHQGVTFPEAVQFVRERTQPSVAPRIAATYVYRDEHGEVLYRKLRYELKGFSQQRPDGNGGWFFRLGRVRRVLYRLPELAGRTAVVLCEGEQDADRLWSLGIPATTRSEGATATPGKNWRPPRVYRAACRRSRAARGGAGGQRRGRPSLRD